MTAPKGLLWAEVYSAFEAAAARLWRWLSPDRYVCPDLPDTDDEEN